MVHPMYRNMHSYPGTEPTSAQMYTNPSRPPISYGYAPPIACYDCCNHHTYMPAHPNWGSPYSHHIPPPSHCPVSYPSFPPQYMPCYPMGQPRYEFEKNVPMMHGQHCCGCLNHLSHPVEPGNVRIDEEPDSVAPLHLKNGHSPIVWMPPDNYGNAKEQQKDNDEGNNNNQVVWKDGAKNGWYPLDLNNLVSMKKESGDEERKHQRGDHDESVGRHCSLPLFWIPYKPEEKEKEMEMEKHNLGNLNTKSSLDQEMSSPGEKKIQVKEESSKSRERESDTSVKDGIIGEKKLPKEHVKRENPSLPKSLKLPPVCLRVDPLRRRKTANGSLQSNEAKTKVTNSSGDKVCNIVPTNEVKEGKGTKTIKVVDGKTLQENNMHVNLEARFDQPEVKPEMENSNRECIENDAMKGCQSEEVLSAMGKNEEGTKVTNKRKFSEEEAAVIIQSVYRGYDTRRWDPVKKLKEIVGVRDEVYSVKQMIQAMETRSDIEGSSKQRNVISETIMRLLLKLDAIQGLHPSIRDVRRSVVKELVSLQEKLDSIMMEKLGNSSQQESKLGCEEDASNKIEDATLSENNNEVPVDLSEADQNLPKGEVDEVLMDKLKEEDGKRNEELESDEISDHENLMAEQSSDVPILPDSSIKEADQNQPKGAFVCENSEILEANEVLMDKLVKEDEKSNGGLESDKISDNHENLMVEQSSEVPILHDPSIKEADKNQSEGTFICENSEISEANEVLMDKLEKEGEKSNEGLENDEVSDNCENLMVEQSSEVQILPDSSIKEADQNQPVGAFICENSEIPEADEVLMDKLEKEDEKCNEGLESDEISDHENLMVEQSSKVPTLPDSTLKLADFAPSDRDERDSELAELPQGDLDDLHAQEKRTCQEEEGPVTLESQNDELDDVLEADIKTCHGDKFEHEERIETKSGMGVGDTNDSFISEKAIDNPPEKEVSGDQLLHEDNPERDTAEETDASVKEPENDTAEENANGDEKIGAPEMNVVPEKGKVDLTESNRKLLEENEKLRVIMKNLIKLGQEQLTAISSLTGRVEDLERKLCKKKKLKVKQGKGRKMRDLVHE